MATQTLSENFRVFFSRLNPSDQKIKSAALEHARVTDLITDRSGPAAVLSPVCFLQGSYKQQTAIHDINDVDVVALCELWHPPSEGGSRGRRWSRDEIFATIAAALMHSGRYTGAVEYGPHSTCVKVNGTIRVEVLPVVFAAGNYDADKEPFKLYRPEHGQWEDGYARYHQAWLTWKNQDEKTAGNCIPAIKVLKHIRTQFGLDAVSFHIECLLFALGDGVFLGSAADYVTRVLREVANRSAEDWYTHRLATPCGDRDVFTGEEWSATSWWPFHKLIGELSPLASAAASTVSRGEAIRLWQAVLGDQFFPHL